LEQEEKLDKAGGGGVTDGTLAHKTLDFE